MKITIIGGGNIGTLMAGEFACKGHEVTIYTSKPEKWSKNIDVLDLNGERIMTGQLADVTSDLARAVEDAELIFITFPAQMFSTFGKEICKHIKPNQMVGVVPGSGGAEFAFNDVVKNGGILFGLQRVHSIARLEEYGKSVYMLGRKSKLEVGVIPHVNSPKISAILEDLFDLPCEILKNYLCVTLTPSNPILHTSRLYAMFKDYREGVVYPRNFLFYEEWDLHSAEMLLACDGELQNLCNAIPMDLTGVVSLRDYYESPTAQAMVEKLRSIRAFKNITSPMIECDGGWVPDLNSRYFTTDFLWGLKIIKDLAETYGIDTPNINKIWAWYEMFDSKHAKTAFTMNIKKDEFEKLYQV